MMDIRSIGRKVVAPLGGAAVAVGLLGLALVAATAGGAPGFQAIDASDAVGITGGQTGCSNYTANPVLCIGGRCSPCPSGVLWNGGGNVSLKNVTTGPVTCYNCGGACNTVNCSNAAFCMAPGRSTYDLADVAVHNHEGKGL